MARKLNKSLILMCISVLFLINPTVNIKDFLPDFFGYGLLFIALTNIARLEESLLEARKKLLILAGITAVKFLIVTVFSETENITGILFAFSFAVVEAIVFLPMAKALLEGMGYLVTRHSGENKANPEKLKKITYIAFSVKALIYFLPLVPNLSESGSTVYGEVESVWSQFTNLYYVFGGILVSVFGIIWAVKFVKMNLSLYRDKTFCENIEALYEKEIASNPGKLTADRMKTAQALIVAASVFTFNFYIDNVNVFPNFTVAAVLLVSLWMMYEAPLKLKIATSIAGLCWGIFSYISLKLQMNFDKENYSPEWALHNMGKSAEMYKTIEITGFIEGVLFLLTVVLFAISMKKAIENQTKGAERLEKIVPTLKKNFIPLLIFAIIIALLNCATAVIMMYFPLVWMVNGGLVIILTVLSYRAYVAAQDNLYHRMSL